MPEPWPDLSGDMPTDEFWSKDGRELWWAAVQSITAGSSQAKAGKAVGRQPGTISGWIRQLRARYGEDFLRPQTPRKQPPAEAALTAAVLNGEEVAAEFRTVRAAAATENYALAELSRSVARAHLERHLAEGGPLLTPHEIYLLSRAADLFEGRAQKLELHDGSPGGGPGSDTPEEMGNVPPGIMAALDAPESDAHAALAKSAGESLRAFHLISGGAEEVLARDGTPEAEAS